VYSTYKYHNDNVDQTNCLDLDDQSNTEFERESIETQFYVMDPVYPPFPTETSGSICNAEMEDISKSNKNHNEKSN